MVVPNYIPPPVEVPGNVSQEPYLARLRFIRRVSVLHFLSLLIVGAVSMAKLPNVPLLSSAAEAAAVLFILSMVRIGTRATRYDLIISASLLPVLLALLALIVRTLNASGWPVWGMAVGSGFALLYGLLCGRDFSFVGQFCLALIASSVLLAAYAVTFGMEPHEAGILLGANAVFLFYQVYDLASLLARRRLGEELAAVADLYRDVFNVFGYVVRVARHWRKHRIWAR